MFYYICGLYVRNTFLHGYSSFAPKLIYGKCHPWSHFGHVLLIKFSVVVWKLKQVYLHFRKTCSHQTCQDGEYNWGANTNKVMWNFDHVKLSTNSQRHMNLRSQIHEVMWRKKNDTTQLLQGILAPNMTG